MGVAAAIPLIWFPIVLNQGKAEFNLSDLLSVWLTTQCGAGPPPRERFGKPGGAILLNSLQPGIFGFPGRIETLVDRRCLIPEVHIFTGIGLSGRFPDIQLRCPSIGQALQNKEKQ